MKDANLMIKKLLTQTFLLDNDSFWSLIRFNSQSL